MGTKERGVYGSWGERHTCLQEAKQNFRLPLLSLKI